MHGKGKLIIKFSVWGYILNPVKPVRRIKLPYELEKPNLMLLLFSHQVMFDYLWPHGLQHTRHPCLPKFAQIHELVMLFDHLILCHPLLFLLSIFSSIRVFSNESILYIRWPKTGASVLASALPMNIQDWFPLGLIGLMPVEPKGLLRVFHTQLESINSLVLSLLYGPTLTSIHAY